MAGRDLAAEGAHHHVALDLARICHREFQVHDAAGMAHRGQAHGGGNEERINESFEIQFDLTGLVRRQAGQESDSLFVGPHVAPEAAAGESDIGHGLVVAAVEAVGVTIEIDEGRRRRAGRHLLTLHMPAPAAGSLGQRGGEVERDVVAVDVGMRERQAAGHARVDPAQTRVDLGRSDVFEAADDLQPSGQVPMCPPGRGAADRLHFGGRGNAVADLAAEHEIAEPTAGQLFALQVIGVPGFGVGAPVLEPVRQRETIDVAGQSQDRLVLAVDAALGVGDVLELQVVGQSRRQQALGRAAESQARLALHILAGLVVLAVEVVVKPLLEDDRLVAYPALGRQLTRRAAGEFLGQHRLGVEPEEVVARDKGAVVLALAEQ